MMGSVGRLLWRKKRRKFLRKRVEVIVAMKRIFLQTNDLKNSLLIF